MVFGVGIDLIEVARVKKAVLNNNTFLNKVYGNQELNKCENINNKYQCLAARFAGKEAFMKALGSGWSEGIKWSEVEIINDQLGKPVLSLSGKALELVNQLEINRMNISLTHINDFASAIVILETGD